MAIRAAYKEKGIKVYEARWEDVLPGLRGGTVDLVIADPPYKISKRRSRFVQCGYERDHDFGEWDHEPFDLSGLFVQIKRLLKPGGLWWCFYDIWRLDIVRQAARDAGLHPWVPFFWHKTNPSPAFGFRHPLNAAEGGVFGAWDGNDKAYRFAPGGYIHNVLVGAACSEKKLNGRARKPVWLVRKMIETSSGENDKVLDPCFGTGPVLKAARDLGRRVVGVERDPGKVQVAIRRLEEGNEDEDEQDTQDEQGALEI